MNVVPRPGSLSTSTSPPIIWQNRRVIVRPRPVPPYFRVVEASAWVNGLEQPGDLLGRHPDARVADAEDHASPLPSTAARAPPPA